jgi:hypothetical protein
MTGIANVDLEPFSGFQSEMPRATRTTWKRSSILASTAS